MVLWAYTSAFPRCYARKNGLANGKALLAALLLQLCRGVVAKAAFVMPLVPWQVKKNKLPSLDVHGKVVANWLISALIHGIVSGLLVFVLIGFPLLGILGGRSIAFPIIGAVKANEGVVWAYQLSIEFFA